MFTSADDEQVFQKNKEVCLSLWPFIRDLPDNIASVRRKTPPHMEAAEKLFSQLADEERVYQQLYLRQCRLAGITDRQLETVVPTAGAKLLSDAIHKSCQTDTYVNGGLAIITAELGASTWARTAQPVFETYFQKHQNAYQSQAIEEGLEWLRLHAKPNLKHAIWMRKMLGDLADTPSNRMPTPVVEVLQALYAVLQVEKQIPTKLTEEFALSSQP